MKTLLAVAIAVAIGVAGCVGYSIYRSYTADKGFKQVRMGTPENQVVMLMGKPTTVVLPGDKRFWSSNVKGSVKEFHYEPNILPEIWVIGFDAKENVVYRNHNLM